MWYLGGQTTSISKSGGVHRCVLLLTASVESLGARNGPAMADDITLFGKRPSREPHQSVAAPLSGGGVIPEGHGRSRQEVVREGAVSVPQWMLLDTVMMGDWCSWGSVSGQGGGSMSRTTVSLT